MNREAVRAIKTIGEILKLNRMGTVPEGQEHEWNPLWTVRLWDDEIKDLCKGKIPEDWSWLSHEEYELSAKPKPVRPARKLGGR